MEKPVRKNFFSKAINEIYSPSTGNIYIDNIEFNNFDVYEIRQAIAYVSQEDFLFTASIRENLKMGNEKISDDEMIEIACRTGADQFIRKMERGYDSILEERGYNLSKAKAENFID